MKEIRFSAEADIELSKAAYYYENECPGFGYEFLEAVPAALERIQTFPEAYPRIRGDVRRMIMKRFTSYEFLYVVELAFIEIIAVKHSSRKPDYWLERLPPERR